MSFYHEYFEEETYVDLNQTGSPGLQIDVGQPRAEVLRLHWAHESRSVLVKLWVTQP